MPDSEPVLVLPCDRPVVPLTRWLAGALAHGTRCGRQVVLLTPPGTRLTVPAASALLDADGRWVIRDRAGGGCYDGFWGLTLAPDRFGSPAGRPDAEVAPAFRDAPPPDGQQLRLCLEVRHPATRWVTLGGALEALYRGLTGAPPAGFGPTEPVGERWRPAELTGYARDRATGQCRLIVVGGGDAPAIGTVEVARIPAGLIETLDVTVGYPGTDPVPVERLSTVVGTLLGAYRLSWLYAQSRPGRADLTRPAHAEGLATPVGIALPEGGPDGPVRWRPVEHAGTPRAWHEMSELFTRLTGALAGPEESQV
jgi:hypothetical protein